MKHPYHETSSTWLTQSAQLISAYPTTTRVTTKYSIKAPPTASELSKKRKRTPLAPTSTTTKSDAEPTEPAQVQSPEEAVKNMTPRASITLKTFEPGSGICIKYKTDKEREVGRLIANLGRLARGMAALPVEDVGAEVEKAGDGEGQGEDGGVPLEGEKTAPAGAAANASAGPTGAGGAGGAGGGGGGKKKKKGKR